MIDDPPTGLTTGHEFLGIAFGPFVDGGDPDRGDMSVITVIDGIALRINDGRSSRAWW